MYNDIKLQAAINLRFENVGMQKYVQVVDSSKWELH